MSSDDKDLPVFCGKCGEKIVGVSMFCSKCGSPTKHNDSSAGEHRQEIPRESSPRLQRPAEWKSESTTLLLSIILGIFGISGVGHMYVGKVGKGVGILIVGLLIFIIGVVTLMIIVGIVILILYIPFFIWQVVDSRKLCREYNDYYEQHGKPPSW